MICALFLLCWLKNHYGLFTPMIRSEDPVGAACCNWTTIMETLYMHQGSKHKIQGVRYMCHCIFLSPLWMTGTQDQITFSLYGIYKCLPNTFWPTPQYLCQIPFDLLLSIFTYLSQLNILFLDNVYINPLHRAHQNDKSGSDTDDAKWRLSDVPNVSIL